MAISVSFFNANSLPVNVNVNNGNAFQISAAGPPNWVPQTPSNNPGFNYGPPSPGTLGIGPNSVVLSSEGSMSPLNVSINLPGTVNWMAIQVYLFLGYDGGAWLVLNNGQIVSQGNVSANSIIE